MAGLSQEELVEILNRINSTDQIRKSDLHEAIASAIVENNKKVVQDFEERNRQNIQNEVQRRVDEGIQLHIDNYH
ncbi:MAG: hypothetical protein N4A68_08505 [Maledivibacter sp.]|jgi:hypothetical protein|nr:hypothetical protein [Maledivibacter sp.]